MTSEPREVPEDASEPVPADARPGDPIDVAWAAVEADWDGVEAHKKFLALADGLDRLADAGRRYREVRDTDPARREAAARHIDQLLGLAMKRVKVDRVEPVQGRSRVEWIALGVSIVLIAAALVSALRMIAP